ncbi:MAG: response regulator [Candidatus Sumerlaeia bacterium]
MDKAKQTNSRPLFPSLSIRQRLFFVIVLMIFCASLVIGFFVTYTAYMNGREQIIEKLESVALVKKGEIHTWVENMHVELSFVLHGDIAISQAMDLVLPHTPPMRRDRSADILSARFQESLGLSSWIDEVFLLNNQGDVVLSTNPHLVGQYRGLQRYFVEGLEKPGTHVQSFSFTSQSEGVNTIVASQPLRNVFGEKVGVICGRASLDGLNSITQAQMGLGKTGEIYIVGQNHVLLTECQQPGFEPGSAFLHSMPIEMVVSRKNTEVEHAFSRNYRGTPVASVYVWIPELQVGLIAEQAESEAFAPIISMIRVNGLITLVASFLAAWVAFLLAKNLTGPIVRLSDAAEEIAQGQYKQKVTVERNDEIGALARAFNNMSDRLQKAFTSLREREQNLSITLDSIGDAVIATDAMGTVMRLNPVAEKLTGWPVHEAQGRHLGEIFRIRSAQEGVIVQNPVDVVLREGQVVGLANDTILVSRDGTEMQIADSGAPIRNAQGKIVGVVLVFRDVTEEYQTQEQLRQAQKMEAVGQLAGGVAHDFNNILTGIMGNAQLLQIYMQDDNVDKHSPAKLRAQLDDITKASQRAAELTRQLLSFSRKGKIQITEVSLHQVIEEATNLLSHSIDRRIDIVKNLKAQNPTVQGDPSQLENAFLNLGLNARDAMPNGGTLVYETSVTILDQAFCDTRAEDLEPGNYVRITVSDTGSGIAPNNLRRIFEPFFTTKGLGDGTGLGLASVYGCVKSHHGIINVKSKVGEGTCFEILLPQAELTTPHEIKAPEANTTQAGTGHILVVEDEVIVRNFIISSLQALGYRVTGSNDGQEAVEVFEKKHESIDLVILDLIMPRMSGQHAFTKMREIDPDIPVVVVSGYSQEHIIQNLMERGASAFLSKPFLVADLAEAVSNSIRARSPQ